MEKVICDICGTSYPESEECCPVCGSFQDLEFNFDLEMEEDDFLKDSPIVAVKEQKLDDALEEFLNATDEEEESEEDDEGEEEEEEEPRRGKAGVVILLVILIMLLLAVCGFLFVRYILPNMDMGEPAASESLLQTEEPVETTTEPGIPCEQLILTSGATLDMTREGEYKLINVMAKPEDTTDKITYISSDESIATVSEDGRITGLAEGEATITVICGEQQVECLVRVQYVEETEPTTEPVQETEAPAETDEAEQSEPVEETTEATTAATEAQLKDVTLKLGRTDVSMGVGYQFTIPLECDLEYSEIEWSTGNPGIATIQDGVITTLSKGTTQMFAKYGDQVVTGWIRVK